VSKEFRTVRLSIKGRVQGVWYRGWTVETASCMGLDGWVRNRADGSVEALFSGPQAKIEAMIEACRRGPPAAKVVSIDIVEEDACCTDTGFHQLSTV
jgi:acylphosphatase